MPKKIIVPLAKGFEEIEAISIIDIVRRGGVDVVVAGVKTLEVEGANKIMVKCDALLQDVDASSADMIVLPGGWGGTRVLSEDESVQNMIKSFDNEGKWVAAMCAAPFALNVAGVLKNDFTCYPGARAEIKTDAIYHDNQKVVIDENIITSQGPGTAICFGLAIVRTLQGDEVADTIKGGVLADFC
jgi:4-methyl-5(b-hydroxyethyl)-thiazole monophosphate biosynthesis